MGKNDMIKKCGMVTLYDDNFGTCLQAFALYTKIKEFGYEPTIIRYAREEKNNLQGTGMKLKLKKFMKASPMMLLNYALSYKNIRERKEGFSKFRNKYLNFTEEINYRDFITDAAATSFDGYVCGSDMIWSEEFVKDWDYFFMKFVPMGKRIAYAPSFGKSEISINNRDLCEDLIKGITYISCREEAGVTMIKQYYGMDVKQVLDPTLLMEKDEWNTLIKSDTPILNEKYVLTYVFGGLMGPREKIFTQIKAKNWGNHKVIPMNKSQYGKDSVDGVLGPKEFINLYRHAEFIITDTFHGMIFALIYEKPFVVLKREDGGHWAKYSDRMTSTLSMLGLEERYINNMTVIPDRFKELDYMPINMILQQKRAESLRYLRDSLEEVMY